MYFISLKEKYQNNNNNFYVDNFKLMPAKKNYKPKSDMPSYSNKSILRDLKNERISFICINNENIVFKEKGINEIDEINNHNNYCEEEDEIDNNNSFIIKRKNSISKSDDMSHSFCLLI